LASPCNTIQHPTAVVERGDIVASVQAAGTLNAVVTVEVGSQISGQIKELFADFNSSVTEGQVIARVEPESYEAKLDMAVVLAAHGERGGSRQNAALRPSRRGRRADRHARYGRGLIGGPPR
jgi:multidrug efflux pump subunit AcrA (membrane-fusion protein)